MVNRVNYAYIIIYCKLYTIPNMVNYILPYMVNYLYITMYCKLYIYITIYGKLFIYYHIWSIIFILPYMVNSCNIYTRIFFSANYIFSNIPIRVVSGDFRRT